MKLTIDGREVVCREGQTLLEAARGSRDRHPLSLRPPRPRALRRLPHLSRRDRRPQGLRPVLRDAGRGGPGRPHPDARGPRAAEEGPRVHPGRASLRLPRLRREDVLRRPQVDDPQGRRGHRLRPLPGERRLRAPEGRRGGRARAGSTCRPSTGTGTSGGTIPSSTATTTSASSAAAASGSARRSAAPRSCPSSARGGRTRGRHGFRPDAPRFRLPLLRGLRRRLPDRGPGRAGRPATAAARPHGGRRLPVLRPGLPPRSRDPGGPGPPRPAGRCAPNHGQACVKGRFLVRGALDGPGRILEPRVRRDGRLVPATFDEALDAAAAGLASAAGGRRALVYPVAGPARGRLRLPRIRAGGLPGGCGRGVARAVDWN
ncbi:MAG: hypothetical protein M0C28_15270 [Candidatus Moduliflexus flocculans]|nr:hypothetical protein [Candidatus Moduliflexus flocculans]